MQNKKKGYYELDQTINNLLNKHEPLTVVWRYRGRIKAQV